ncbi:hypothetical protein BDN70DRAFT_874825 [Pholiota conissans]|uniref:Nuclear transport factor 2 domain-containing protein n=1 Tax=Pholiota conissans TaxID=109636 RepID=A0A9P5ZAX7_9AGAR|nr:hypothetical protein BDN70DRAFT_874825 [Pholiota conissans]
MLKQYGIAAPSSLTPILHPEDAQPNERTHARSQKLPPRILGAPPYRGTNYQPGHTQRGGYRGRAMYRGGPFTQHAVRGGRPCNDRGRGSGTYRGVSKSIRKPVLQHWSRLEGVSTSMGASAVEPIDVDATRPSLVPISTPISVSSTDTPDATPVQHPLPSPQARPQTVSEALKSQPPYVLPDWLRRSRSPSPKLPPTPLKRRMPDFDDEKADSRRTKSPRLSVPIIEAFPALPPPPSPVSPTPHVPLPSRAVKQATPSAPIPKSTTPLPGRKLSTPIPVRKSSTPIVIKSERMSPDTIQHVPEPGPSTIKHERRSPSISLIDKPARRLITESAQFYPLPDSCRKSNPQFAEERRKYFRLKSKALLNLGLKKTKAFWRDDGLVIEWISDVPVWSDTLKPDILDLASAIERAYALNDLNLPRKTPKQKRNSLTNGVSTPGSRNTVDTPASSSSRPPPSRRHSDIRTQVKHWADGIPPEVLQDTPGLFSPPPYASPSKPVRPPPRAALPTRKQIPKPSSSSSNLPFTQPDPSAVIPSQEWRITLASSTQPAVPYPSKRMIFKPMNPRKFQAEGVAQDSPVAQSATGSQGSLSQRTAVSPGATELAEPMQNGSSHAGRGCPRETASTSFELLVHLSPKSTTSKDVPTPETSSRSPTLVNESVSTTTLLQGHDQQSLSHLTDEGLGWSMPEHEPMSAYGVIAHRTNDHDVEKEDSEFVTADLLRGIPAPLEDESSDDDEFDEEVERSVQQFISKYASMFDSDRHKLKKAYSKDALFSCRVHHTEPYSCASLFVSESKDSFQSKYSRASASQVIRGRTHICDRLLTLGQYQFIPRGVPQNPLYTWSIPKFSGVPDGILLSLHGEVVKPEVDPALDHRLAVDQTLLLRQRFAEDDTDDDDGTDIPGQMNLKNFWPLTIVSHQMTVRSNPMLNPEDLEEIPWVRDILST